MSETLLSLAEVSAMLNVAPLTVRRMSLDGRFPSAIQVGALLRWRPADVRAWLAQGGSVAPAGGPLDLQTRPGVAHQARVV